MNPTISIIVVVILFLAAIIRNIDWKAHAIKWVGNNPAKSQHYITAGDTVHTVEGHRIMMAAEGQTYAYQDNKETYIVDIPANYPYKYIRGRRIIGQSDGQLVADPLGMFRPEQMAKIQEGLTETSALLEGNVMIKAIQSVKSNKAKNMMIWLLIGAVAIGGYMYYRNSQEKNENTANVTTAIATPAVTIPAVTTTKNPSFTIVPRKEE